MGTDSNAYSYSKPYSYAYTNTHSISYSCAQSDSQASSHATSSPDSAMKKAALGQVGVNYATTFTIAVVFLCIAAAAPEVIFVFPNKE